MRNTGRTDDAVVIMVIMMQQHTNIYKLHLAARLIASSDRDYVTHRPLLGDERLDIRLLQMFIKIREMKDEAKSNEAIRPCCDVTFPVNS